MRENIKDALFDMLKNQRDPNIVKAGATCVAAIAVIEIPMGAWMDLLP